MLLAIGLGVFLKDSCIILYVFTFAHDPDFYYVTTFIVSLAGYAGQLYST